MVRSRPGLTIRALPTGNFSVRQRVGLEMVVKIFVLAVDHRIVDRDRVEQHGVGVFHRGRRHHDQPGIMRVDRFHALAVERPAAFRSARGQTHRDRTRHVAFANSASRRYSGSG